MGIRKYCSICEGEFIGHSIRIYFWSEEDNKLKLAHKGCYEDRNNPDLYFYIRRTRPTKWD